MGRTVILDEIGGSGGGGGAGGPAPNTVLWTTLARDYASGGNSLFIQRITADDGDDHLPIITDQATAGGSSAVIDGVRNGAGEDFTVLHLAEGLGADLEEGDVVRIDRLVYARVAEADTTTAVIAPVSAVQPTTTITAFNGATMTVRFKAHTVFGDYVGAARNGARITIEVGAPFTTEAVQTNLDQTEFRVYPTQSDPTLAELRGILERHASTYLEISATTGTQTGLPNASSWTFGGGSDGTPGSAQVTINEVNDAIRIDDVIFFNQTRDITKRRVIDARGFTSTTTVLNLDPRTSFAFGIGTAIEVVRPIGYFLATASAIGPQGPAGPIGTAVTPEVFKAALTDLAVTTDSDEFREILDIDSDDIVFNTGGFTVEAQTSPANTDKVVLPAFGGTRHYRATLNLAITEIESSVSSRFTLEGHLTRERGGSVTDIPVISRQYNRGVTSVDGSTLSAMSFSTILDLQGGDKIGFKARTRVGDFDYRVEGAGSAIEFERLKGAGRDGEKGDKGDPGTAGSDGVVTGGSVSGTTLTLERSQSLADVTITGLPSGGGGTNVKGMWAAATTYSRGDIVAHDDVLWIQYGSDSRLNAANPPSDPLHWFRLSRVLDRESGYSYRSGDMVIGSDDRLYVCITDGANIATDPTANPDDWFLFNPVRQGLTWNTTRAYARGDVVHSGSNLYICVEATSTGTNPTTSGQTHWLRLGGTAPRNFVKDFVRIVTASGAVTMSEATDGRLFQYGGSANGTYTITTSSAAWRAFFVNPTAHNWVLQDQNTNTVTTLTSKESAIIFYDGSSIWHVVRIPDKEGTGSSLPDAPAHESEAKKYNLNVPATSGAVTWTEDTGGGGTTSTGIQGDLLAVASNFPTALQAANTAIGSVTWTKADGAPSWLKVAGNTLRFGYEGKDDETGIPTNADGYLIRAFVNTAATGQPAVWEQRGAPIKSTFGEIRANTEWRRQITVSSASQRVGLWRELISAGADINKNAFRPIGGASTLPANLQLRVYWSLAGSGPQGQKGDKGDAGASTVSSDAAKGIAGVGTATDKIRWSDLYANIPVWNTTDTYASDALVRRSRTTGPVVGQGESIYINRSGATITANDDPNDNTNSKWALVVDGTNQVVGGAFGSFMASLTLAGPVYLLSDSRTRPTTPAANDGTITAGTVTTAPTGGWVTTEVNPTNTQPYVWATYALCMSSTEHSWLNPFMEEQSTALRPVHDVLASVTNLQIAGGTSSTVGSNQLPQNDPAAFDDRIRIRCRTAGGGAWTETYVDRAVADAWTQGDTYIDADNSVRILQGSGFEVRLHIGASSQFRAWMHINGALQQFDIDIDRERVVEGIDRVREAIQSLLGGGNAYTDADHDKLDGIAEEANKVTPYKIGNIYRGWAKADGQGLIKPPNGSGAGGNAQGVVTASQITTAPAGWSKTRPEPTEALPYVFDCHTYGYNINGTFQWQWGTPNRTDRYIYTGPPLKTSKTTGFTAIDDSTNPTEDAVLSIPQKLQDERTKFGMQLRVRGVLRGTAVSGSAILDVFNGSTKLTSSGQQLLSGDIVVDLHVPSAATSLTFRAQRSGTDFTVDSITAEWYPEYLKPHVVVRSGVGAPNASNTHSTERTFYVMGGMSDGTGWQFHFSDYGGTTWVQLDFGGSGTPTVSPWERSGAFTRTFEELSEQTTETLSVTSTNITDGSLPTAISGAVIDQVVTTIRRGSGTNTVTRTALSDMPASASTYNAATAVRVYDDGTNTVDLWVGSTGDLLLTAAGSNAQYTYTIEREAISVFSEGVRDAIEEISPTPDSATLVPETGTTGHPLLKTAAGSGFAQVGTAGIADDAVTAAKVADGAIDHANKLGNNIVTNGKLSTTVQGQLVDAGGSQYHVLRKKTNNNNDTEWGQVKTAGIEGAAVTAGKLASSAVTEAKIATGAVTGTKIGAGAVGTGKLADDAVTSAKLADSSVFTAHIGVGNVTTDRLHNDAVTSAKLADDSVGAEHIKDDAVVAAAIADDAVVTAAINDGAVVAAGLASNAVTEAKINAGAVTAGKIGAGAVINAKIADGAVTTAKISDSGVTQGKIASNAVTQAKMADSAIGATELASNAVITAKIQDSAVTSGKLASNAVTSAKIASNAVTTAKVTDGAITAAKIASGVIPTVPAIGNPLPGISGLTVVYDRQTSIVTPGTLSNGRVMFYNSTGNGGTGTRSILGTYRDLLSATDGLGNTFSNSRYMQLGVSETDKRSGVGNQTPQFTDMLQGLWGYTVVVLVYWADDRWILYGANAAGNSQFVRNGGNANFRLGSVQAFNLSGVGSLDDALDNSDIIVKWSYAPDISGDNAQARQLVLFQKKTTQPSAPTKTWEGTAYSSGGAWNGWSETIPSGSDPLWLAYAEANRPAGGSWTTNAWQIIRNDTDTDTDTDTVSTFGAEYTTTPNVESSWSTTVLTDGFVRFRHNNGSWVGPIALGAHTAQQPAQTPNHEFTELFSDSFTLSSTATNKSPAQAFNFANYHDIEFQISRNQTTGTKYVSALRLQADQINFVNNGVTTGENGVLLYSHPRRGLELVTHTNQAAEAPATDDTGVRLYFQRQAGVTSGFVLGRVAVASFAGDAVALRIYIR